LDEITKTTDENNTLFLKTNDRMKNVISNSSNCKMIMFLFVELALFVVFLVYLWLFCKV
jgi:hypothetical protein